jgi:hypothetical protein
LRKPRHGKADHPAAVAQGKPKIAIDRGAADQAPAELTTACAH